MKGIFFYLTVIFALLLIVGPSVSSAEWKNAGSLEEGEWLLTSGGEWVQVESVSISYEPVSFPVFNLNIGGSHNYFVGVQGILVHNKPVFIDDMDAAYSRLVTGGYEPVDPKKLGSFTMQSAAERGTMTDLYEGTSGFIVDSSTGKSYFVKGGPSLDFEEAGAVLEFRQFNHIEEKVHRLRGYYLDDPYIMKIEAHAIDGVEINGIKRDIILTTRIDGESMAQRIGRTDFIDLTKADDTPIDILIADGILTKSQDETLRRHFLWDLWVANRDRKPQNLLLVGENSVAMIDEGFSLNAFNNYEFESPLSFKGAFEPHFSGGRETFGTVADQNPVYRQLARDFNTKPKAVLEEMRPTAEAIASRCWHSGMAA